MISTCSSGVVVFSTTLSSFLSTGLFFILVVAVACRTFAGAFGVNGDSGLVWLLLHIAVLLTH